MLDRRFAIAPMMDWTDRHCRVFHRLMSRHALLYTEMLTTGAIIHGDRARQLFESVMRQRLERFGVNADFALASNPCFINNERSIVPHLSPDWTWRAMIVIAVAALAVALAATLVAWRAYRLTKEESSGDHDLMEIGAGRTRFLALWGICLGAGSALIIMTTLAFFALPRCAG